MNIPIDEKCLPHATITLDVNDDNIFYVLWLFLKAEEKARQEAEDEKRELKRRLEEERLRRAFEEEERNRAELAAKKQKKQSGRTYKSSSKSPTPPFSSVSHTNAQICMETAKQSNASNESCMDKNKVIITVVISAHVSTLATTIIYRNLYLNLKHCYKNADDFDSDQLTHSSSLMRELICYKSQSAFNQ